MMHTFHDTNMFHVMKWICANNDSHRWQLHCTQEMGHISSFRQISSSPNPWTTGLDPFTFNDVTSQLPFYVLAHSQSYKFFFLLTYDVVCYNIHSSPSHMRVMNHNWSATKQCLHLQSIAEISRHSVLSGDRIRQCETSIWDIHRCEIDIHLTTDTER